MQRSCFRTGQLLILNSTSYKVWRILENDSLILERLSDLAHIMRSKSELLDALLNKDLSFVLTEEKKGETSTEPALTGPLDAFSERDQKIALRKLAYIKLAIQEVGVKPSCKKLKVHLETFAKHLRDSNPPGAYSIYRWWCDWSQSGEDVSVLLPKPNKGRVSTYLREFRLLINEVADELIYQKVPCTKLDAYNLFKVKATEANSLRAIPKPIPSKATFYRLLDKIIDPYKLVLTQQGRQAAEKAFRATGAGVRTTRILERVEIDHTPINLMVVDEMTGEVCGRPSLTVVIDHFSRMPLGIYVGFEPPSGVSVMRAMRNAILPKGDIEKRFPDFAARWTAFGLFGLMACDNGSEFHDKQLKRICHELNVELLFCPKKTPWFKGSVERFLGTLNKSTSNKMEGTTFSSISERGTYNSVAEARHTLKELERIIHYWFINIYAADFHEGLGDTPLNVWNQGLQQVEPCLPANKEHFDLIFTKEYLRQANHEGVGFLRLKYNSAELGILRRQLKKGNYVRVRVDADNLGSVWIYDEHNACFFSVPCTTPEVAEGVSLRQWIYLLKGRTNRRKAADTDELLQRKVEFLKEIRANSRDKKLTKRTQAARLTQNTCSDQNSFKVSPKKRDTSPLSLPDDIKELDIQWRCCDEE